nr:transposase, MuDR, MULE transposase domain protein [Tanacetum cinerariifolium]
MRRIFLDGYGVLVVRIVIFKISSFKLQNARLLLIFTNYFIITAILKYKRLSAYDLEVATPKALVYAGEMTRGDARSWAPWFRATIEELNDEPGSIATNRTEKMLFLTWQLDGEAGFADVARSGLDSSVLSHDESFGVDDLDLKLNEIEPIVAEVSTQEPIVVDVSTQEPIVAEVSTLSSEDAGIDDDDDDEDEDFLVDEENEIVEPDVCLIFDQVRVNPDIPFKAVQDQLQRDLEVQISMSKAFRAKAKAEREIRGDHILQYSMLRDYVVGL